ncbi:hypothetical protein K32_16170 [Kaistia sp. 32K]|uniref:hypothetical protein n=1 Tax=Kaistia sp. 32K TaxID=2795690 RepID=UPI00191598EF|nr:hypothetical protein [Kaistia sp. 32K]BCP53000.1 hypothetical protein K32_16170 [Kaistia sp. 32K]
MTSIGTGSEPGDAPPGPAFEAETGAKTPPRHRAYIGNALLFSASILLSLAGAELVLRAFPQYQVQTGEGEYRFCTPIETRHRPHPTFGYTESPENSYFERFSTADPWSYVHINAEGFRDNFDTHGKPILVLGDSMTRGSLVNENETFTDLMDAWHPEWAFRNYGVGGYGQANSIRVYEDKAPALPHTLVIQQYSLSTDIDDNVERASLNGDTVDINIHPAVGTAKDSMKPLARIHLFLWNNSKVYPWIYNTAVRPYFGNWDARRDINTAIEITRRLLGKLAQEAQANNADLLILALPSWAEMAGRDDGMDPKRQRVMLEAFAAATPNAYLLDMSPVLSAQDPSKTYGVVDKHLTPYGQFLVAESIERWLMTDWARGPKATVLPAHEFHAPEPVIPDCSRADAYLKLVTGPHGG